PSSSGSRTARPAPRRPRRRSRPPGAGCPGLGPTSPPCAGHRSRAGRRRPPPARRPPRPRSAPPSSVPGPRARSRPRPRSPPPTRRARYRDAAAPPGRAAPAGHVGRGVVDDVVVQESRRLDQLDRRTVAAQGIELSLRGLLPERRDAAPEAEPGTEQLAALEVLEQPVRQLGGLGRDPRLLAATPRELVTGDLRDPCDQPLIEVVQPLVDGGGVGGGHRGVLSHGPDDPPMPSWAAGPRRRFLPRTGPSPPPAVPPRRVPESARVCA